MPCCGRWGCWQVTKHVLIPMLLVFGVNIMWLTTRLAGPALPTDTQINIIQQAVQTLTTGGIVAMGIKVAAGIKWKNARRNKGTTLRGLLDVLEPSPHKAMGNIRRAGSCTEIFLYLMVIGAGWYHFFVNVGYEPDVLVPAYVTYGKGQCGIPDNSNTWLQAQESTTTDALTQPRNLKGFLETYITGNGNAYDRYSPALLATGHYTQDLQESEGGPLCRV